MPVVNYRPHSLSDPLLQGKELDVQWQLNEERILTLLSRTIEQPLMDDFPPSVRKYCVGRHLVDCRLRMDTSKKNFGRWGYYCKTDKKIKFVSSRIAPRNHTNATNLLPWLKIRWELEFAKLILDGTLTQRVNTVNLDSCPTCDCVHTQVNPSVSVSGEEQRKVEDTEFGSDTDIQVNTQGVYRVPVVVWGDDGEYIRDAVSIACPVLCLGNHKQRFSGLGIEYYNQIQVYSREYQSWLSCDFATEFVVDAGDQALLFKFMGMPDDELVKFVEILQEENPSTVLYDPSG
ncbi:hypothetical protein BDN72DRAFT_905965 [Pluteus cervinus]|uniref:Uncharacterized protein n=1 Tax=Pluteus cervinus TaxID=181527 RepID=A0ACD3A137_9AGAR|nr:hypothetical protein BDN72DRAFT_905965 [Pluteus cervinus]